MKKSPGILGKPISRRSVIKGGAAIAGTTAVTGFPMVWAQNIKDITLNHTGNPIRPRRHRASGEPGSWLQGRDVGHRSSRHHQPHGQRSELDRHRRHRDLADQGLRPARQDPGGRGRKDQGVGQGDAALYRRHLRRQGGVARRRLAVRVSCTAKPRMPRRSRPADRLGDVPARRLQRRHARHPPRPGRPRYHELGRSHRRLHSRARRRSRTFRQSASWMRSWRSVRPAWSNTPTRAT